jgi:UDP-glucuronate 4-epimerase
MEGRFMSNVVLVTGAAGFIGSHLVDRLLAEGNRVVGIDNFCDFYPESIKRENISRAAGSGAFEMVQADIRDREPVFAAMEKHKPGVVVHLAAMAGVRPSIERPDYYTQVNLSGTVNLLDAAVKVGVKKFVFASSSSVYGNNPKAPFSEEDNVDHPISPYAATKKAGELICHAYWHLHRMPITCLRFFTVFGPRQRPDLAIQKFLKLVRDGKPVPVFGDGSTSRDYTFVQDIVDGISRAMANCKTPDQGGHGYRVYNLGGNHPITLSELLETVGRVVGKPVLINRLPVQPGDVERTWADLSRSGRELGYAPHTSIQEGITRQWEWLQKQGG